MAEESYKKNVNQWLKKNEENLKPPICNSVMWGGLLKIMFVGGPNSRKDYHLDQGEELFYMIKGDMCLKIMEKGEPKDVHIKEGEVFLLPSCIPHSPQRQKNTLGLVIERERSHLWDGLRYYCEDGKTILWQKFFHLTDLKKDFLPVIKEFFESDECKSGNPPAGGVKEEPEKFIEDSETVVSNPFSLGQWISENQEQINNGGKFLFGNDEFKIHVIGIGKHNLCITCETWLWIKDGQVISHINGRNSDLIDGDSVVIQRNERKYIKFQNMNSVHHIPVHDSSISEEIEDPFDEEALDSTFPPLRYCSVYSRPQPKHRRESSRERERLYKELVGHEPYYILRQNSNELKGNVFWITLDVKHYRPEEITLKVDGSELVVTGKHYNESEIGFESSEFRRNYTIPGAIDVHTLTSNITSDGVLCIKATKKITDVPEMEKKKEKFQVTLDVKGYRPEEISIRVNHRSIVIHGETKDEKTDVEGSSIHHQQFTRHFTIPIDVDIDMLSSRYTKDNKLTIEAPCNQMDSQERILEIQKE